MMFVRPWETIERFERGAMWRLILNSGSPSSYAGYVAYHVEKGWYYFASSATPNEEYFPTRQEAMDAFDACLVRNGVTLLTEEQYEKIKVLI